MAIKKETTKAEDKEVKKKDPFQDALKVLEGKFGAGTVINGNNVEDIEVVSTGSLTLDLATGIGGWGVGLLIELYGPESSGKSTMTLHAIANYQEKYPDDKMVLLDKESSFDKKYAHSLNVKVDKLVISQPETLEDMYNIAEILIKTDKVRLLVMDSHTSAQPKVIVDGEVGQTQISPAARVNSIGLGKLKPLLKKHRCTIIAVSQLRTAIGAYGDPNKPTGGNGWKFYPDMRVSIAKSIDKEHDLNKTTATIIKSKVSPPFGKAEFNIVWAKGVDRQQEIIDIASEFKILNKAGGWYTLDGGAKIQGDNGMKRFMLDNSEYATDLEDKVITLLKENK